jgi:hypothetical protein
VHFFLPVVDTPETEVGAAHPNTQATTFVLGLLFFHALSSSEPANIARWASDFADRHPGLLKVFPPTDGTLSSPLTTIDDLTANSAASAFHRYIDRISRDASR